MTNKTEEFEKIAPGIVETLGDVSSKLATVTAMVTGEAKQIDRYQRGAFHDGFAAAECIVRRYVFSSPMNEGAARDALARELAFRLARLFPGNRADAKLLATDKPQEGGL